MPKHHFSIEYDVHRFPFTNLLLPSTNTYLGSYVHTYLCTKKRLPTFSTDDSKKFSSGSPKKFKNLSRRRRRRGRVSSIIYVHFPPPPPFCQFNYRAFFPLLPLNLPSSPNFHPHISPSHILPRSLGLRTRRDFYFLRFFFLPLRKLKFMAFVKLKKSSVRSTLRREGLSADTYLAFVCEKIPKGKGHF